MSVSFKVGEDGVWLDPKGELGVPYPYTFDAAGTYEVIAVDDTDEVAGAVDVVVVDVPGDYTFTAQRVGGLPPLALRAEVGAEGHVIAYADNPHGEYAQFDWGDGTAPDTAVDTPLDAPTESATSTHDYTANGDYTITVICGPETATAAITVDTAIVTETESSSGAAGADPVPDGTVSDVLAWVGDDPARVQAAYDAEQAGAQRSTLLAELAARGATA